MAFVINAHYSNVSKGEKKASTVKHDRRDRPEPFDILSQRDSIIEQSLEYNVAYFPASIFGGSGNTVTYNTNNDAIYGIEGSSGNTVNNNTFLNVTTPTQ